MSWGFVYDFARCSFDALSLPCLPCDLSRTPCCMSLGCFQVWMTIHLHLANIPEMCRVQCSSVLYGHYHRSHDYSVNCRQDEVRSAAKSTNIVLRQKRVLYCMNLKRNPCLALTAPRPAASALASPCVASRASSANRLLARGFC